MHNKNDDDPRVQAVWTTLDASSFPRGLLARIFGHLDLADRGRVSQVSRRWRDAAYKTCLWQSDMVKFQNRYFQDCYSTLIPSLAKREITGVHVSILFSNYSWIVQWIKDIFRRMPNLRSFHLSSYHEITEGHIFWEALPSMSDITELKIYDCWYSSGLSKLIEQSCPNLVSLYLGMNRSYILSCNQAPSTLEIACVGLPLLQSLTMINCAKLTDPCLKTIACNLLQLKTLRLTNCGMITDEGICYLVGGQTAQQPNVTFNYPRLETLDLFGCHFLTEVALEYLSIGQKSLKKISISHGMTPKGMADLARMGQLQDISLYFGNCFCAGLRHLTKIRTLQHLQVSGKLCLKNLVILGKFCNLTSLGLLFNNFAPIEGLPYLAKLTRLQHLTLTVWYSKWSSSYVSHFIEGPDYINQFSDCDHYPLIQRNYLECICTLTGLRRLVLEEMRINNGGLSLIAHNLQKLESLFVNGESRIAEIKKRQNYVYNRNTHIKTDCNNNELN